ncbi:hypothetical protein [Candidatus Leptofilum sp.]|uniref:hypothetical protein n=1 Tax=Candidatus Leptofilum sp. TaxID=3241576 RepID=UPI003B592778
MSDEKEIKPVPPDDNPMPPVGPILPSGPCPDPVGPDLERVHGLAEGFAKEYQELCKKYYGDLDGCDFEPFGMKLREIIPLVDPRVGDKITTSSTVSIPWDTDPPMTDTAF